MNSPYNLACVDNCLTCHLRYENFFCAFSQESLEAFNQIKYAAVFPVGAVMFVEGQSPRGIFMLCQGQARLSIASRDGRTVIVRIAKRHEDIAQLTGTSQETVTRTLAEFRKKDIVELKGSMLIIHNKSALERLVEV